MSRSVPGRVCQAAEREQRPQRQVGYRPGRADRDPAAPWLEPCLGRVHVGVREDQDQLEPGLADPAAERRHREPVRRLVHRHHHEAPEQEDEPADADLLGHDERRPVARDDEIGERDETRQRQQRDAPPAPAG